MPSDGPRRGTGRAASTCRTVAITAGLRMLRIESPGCGDVRAVDEDGGRAEPRRVGDQLGVVGDEHGARRDQPEQLGERHGADHDGALVLRKRVRGSVRGQLAEDDELDVRLAVEQLGEAGEDAERVGPVETDQHQARPARPHPPDAARRSGGPRAAGWRPSCRRRGSRSGPIGLPSAAPPVVRNSEANWPMTRRFASCGNGQSRSSVATPACRWTTGICRQKATWAATTAVIPPP